MSEDNSQKKYKRPKEKTLNTTNTRVQPQKTNDVNRQQPLCPLLAKDSEWVDIAKTPAPAHPQPSTTAAAFDEEEELHLIDSEDGPEMKPLAIMFPDLAKDPQTLQSVLDRTMSTTEVTRRLVDLGQKADFTSMKKSSRLIPKDKQRLEILKEEDCCSDDSDFYGSTSYDREDCDIKLTKTRTRKNKEISIIVDSNPTLDLVGSDSSINQEHDDHHEA